MVRVLQHKYAPRTGFLAPAIQASELEYACLPACKGSGALLQDQSEDWQHAAPGTGISGAGDSGCVQHGGWVESQKNG